MVTPARSRVDQSTGNSADEELVGDLQFERLVELLLGGGQHRVELFSLDDGSGESIKDEASKKYVRLHRSPMKMGKHTRSCSPCW